VPPSYTEASAVGGRAPPTVDSFTQLALGAAVGEATLGHRVGRRAALWGAICGTLPDLDVLVPLGGAVAAFTYHRSASHSLFVLAAATLLVARLIRAAHRDPPGLNPGWMTLVYAVFATHVLLDCFTAYGTQILWPFSARPISWSTVFIVDPFYTVPLALGVLCALIARRDRAFARRANALGLALATAYLAWSVGAKLAARDVATHALTDQKIEHQRVLVQATPFNTLLWRIVAMDHDAYYEGFYSLLDADTHIHFRRHDTQPELLRGLEGHWPVQRLQWFTDGFAAIRRQGDDVVISDLRLGIEPRYIFEFRVGKTTGNRSSPLPAERMPSRYRLDGLAWLLRRIVDQGAGFPELAAHDS